MFNFDKFTRKESMQILKGIAIILKTNQGLGFAQALDINLQKFEDNKRVKTLLTRLREDIQGGLDIGEAFELYGLLNEVESVKFRSYSGALYQKLLEILKERSTTEQFEPPVRAMFITYFIAFSALIALIYFMQDFLIEHLIDQNTTNGHKDPYSQIPFFIKHIEIDLMFLAGFAGLILLIVSIYRYYYNNDRGVIYKFINLKEYDDAPLMFLTLYNFHNHYKSTDKAFAQMRQLKSYRGLDQMFIELEEASTDFHATHYDIFKKYGFSKDIVALVQIFEEGNLLENFKELSDYVKEEHGEKLTNYKKSMASFSSIGPYIIFVVFSVYISLLFGIDFDTIKSSWSSARG